MRYRSSAFAAAAYLIVMIVWIFVVDSGRLESQESVGWLAFGSLGLAHVVFGFAIGRWWALLLPLATVLLAVPAEFPESRWSEPPPVFFAMTFYAPFEMVLLALGLGNRWWTERTTRPVGRSAR
jgi:hypothetical protein